MEQDVQTSGLLNQVVFAIAALLLCALAVFAVWLQTLIFYEYRPVVVEYILLLVVSVLSVLACYLIMAPNARSSIAIASLIPIVIFAATLITSTTNVTPSGVVLLALISSIVIAIATRFIHSLGELRVGLRIALGSLLALLCAVLVFAANAMFVVDRFG